ncbi:MAG: hypothetical protein EPN30_01210 [Actinomycetota bacterium]|nr:MAG: hypothetical protein EPN30_01210 [Actinomycetota bacterium]
MSGQDDLSAPLPTAEVLIDSVGLSKVFTYSVPKRFESKIGIGSYVSVRLGNSRAKGWVVRLRQISGAARKGLGFDIIPISRLLGGGPSAEVIALCKWSAWRFIGSPVNFLTHASPKKRISSRPGGELDYERCEWQFRTGRGESLVVRIPPAHSRADWIAEFLGDPSRLSGQTIVVCPTQNMVKYLARSLEACGFSLALFPDEFEKALDGAQIVIGARNAVFASVESLSQIIIVDADDPSHAESSRPIWTSHQVARARVSEGQTTVTLSSVPSVEMMFGARTKALARPQERSGWPKVQVGDISETSGSNPLISAGLIAHIRQALKLGVKHPELTPEGLIDYDGVLVLYNRLGGARTLICSKCNQVVSCVKCSTTLMQMGPGHLRESSGDRREISRNSRQRLAVTGLRCPRCREEYPAICTQCMSGSLKVVTFGIERFRTLLEAAIGTRVTEIDASSEMQISDLGLVTIGTEAIFSRFRSAKMVAIADFDQYLYAPGLDASEVALSILSRAARLVPPRAVTTRHVPLYVQTRDVRSIVVKSAIEGDPRLATTEEAELRKRLNLPPFGAVVRVFGPNAKSWMEKSGIGSAEGVEVISTGEGSFDLRCNSQVRLLDLISKCRSKVSPNGVRFLPDPA